MSTLYKKEGVRKKRIRRLILKGCMTIKHSNKKIWSITFLSVVIKMTNKSKLRKREVNLAPSLRSTVHYGGEIMTAGVEVAG